MKLAVKPNEKQNCKSKDAVKRYCEEAEFISLRINVRQRC
jgi:hypothetical protein